MAGHQSQTWFTIHTINFAKTPPIEAKGRDYVCTFPKKIQNSSLDSLYDTLSG